MRAYRVAYDGRPYHGFQRQPSVPTVEGAVLDALRALDAVGEGDGTRDGAPDDADGTRDAPPEYAAAGRTDAGVSAVAQTVGFDAPDWLTPAALNAELPGDVRAWAGAAAPADFHATRDAAAREYAYHLHAPDTDAERARAALSLLSGTHDFHNLTAAGGDTTRTVEAATAERDGDYLLVRLRAGGFLHEMVRRVVSLVAPVAAGEAGLDRVERALAPEPLTGPEGIPPASPYPLVLVDVAYPGLSFEVEPEAAASARAVFEELRVERETGARVAGAVVDGVDGER